VIEIANEPATIEIDPRAAKQIVLNLLSNAIKFTQAHGQVRLSARRAGEDAFEVEVSDNGPGIPSDQLDKVFSPFWRVEDARRSAHEGTGLGLTICKKLAELLGGTIHIQSKPGEGTTVLVRLPAKRPGVVAAA